MLSHLHIRDFAIVDSVEIDLQPGLTVLTGETGAGKSIVVDALQLAAGGRTGSDIVRHGCERAEVAATFAVGDCPPALRELLEQQSIALEDDELVLRRVVTREGKSRAYLNGQQVPVQVLREAGQLLLDIHGQHEFQSLARPASQRSLLDAFGAHGALAARVAALHADCVRLEAGLEQLASAARDRDARLELLRYQAQELAALGLAAEELPQLVAESTRLGHRGRLAESARAALDVLYEAEDGNAHQHASRALAALRAASALDPQLGAAVETLSEALIRIDDAAHQLSGYLDALEVDPGRQEFVEQRLAAIESLARKHRVPAIDLPERHAAISHEVAGLERIEHDLARLATELAAAKASWHAAALELSALRRTAALRLEAAITERMQALGMKGGMLRIAVQPRSGGQTAASGLDDVEFLVAANPGQPPMPLGKVASGGELSRLSLAVQVTTAGVERSAGHSMVFDEVDSGVGGGVAEIVGRELATLGRSAQVLCVTHLAQVASQAAAHLKVSKLSDGRTTRTQVVSLVGDSRIEEIARMLGGITVTATAREHAAEMLRGASTPARRSPKRTRGAG
jgi:DNA repair protein RecN (Recombination protein N)